MWYVECSMGSEEVCRVWSGECVEVRIESLCLWCWGLGWRIWGVECTVHTYIGAYCMVCCVG